LSPILRSRRKVIPRSRTPFQRESSSRALARRVGVRGDALGRVEVGSGEPGGIPSKRNHHPARSAAGGGCGGGLQGGWGRLRRAGPIGESPGRRRGFPFHDPSGRTKSRATMGASHSWVVVVQSAGTGGCDARARGSPASSAVLPSLRSAVLDLLPLRPGPALWVSGLPGGGPARATAPGQAPPWANSPWA
jgi:hypothetical protein